MKAGKPKNNNKDIPEDQSLSEFENGGDTSDSLHNLDEALSILSSTHLILPRMDNESALLDSICHELVDKKKYYLCWLGLVSTSDGNFFDPLIQKGFQPQEFERFRRAAGSLLGDPKPLLKQLSHESSYLVKSLSDNDTGDKFRQHARKFGYRSVLIIPLNERSNVLGIMSVYSTDKFSFSEAEIKIFQTLAGDISFALISLRVKNQLEKVQEDLRESQQILQLVMDTIPIRLFWKDRNFRYLGCNKAFSRDAGLNSPAEIIGKNDFELSWKESAPLYRSDDREIIEKNISKINYEEPQVREDGSRLWLRTSKIPLQDKNGQIIGLFGSYEDITERKYAEEALCESERRYKMATTAANVGVWDWDMHAGTLFIDPILKALLGYDDHEIENNIDAWKTYIHPDDLDKFQKRAEDYLEGNSDSFELTYRMIHRDGQIKWFQARGIYLADIEGKPYRMLGTNTDITRQVEMQQEQEHMRAQLLQAQKMEAVGTLAGGMAHDFNNLLTSIKGYADLSLMSFQNKEMVERNLKQIQKAVLRAGRLTNQLLLFSRKQMMAPTSISINETITNMLMMLERVIGEDIHIHTDLYAGLWKIWADEGNIEQVIMNLAVNSRDAMPRGGAITMSTANVSLSEPDVQEISHFRPGKFVQLTFSDTGVGMEPDILGHIFEPFFTTKEAGKGTGLGLSVIYGIVSQHDGWIDVASRLGEGTSFKIYIPASFIKSSDETLEKLSLQKYLGHGEALLLVEDEHEIRELIQQVLIEHGYYVLVARSAEEALAIFEENHERILLVFSDVVLPDLNGLALVEKLLQKKPELAVILSSGYTGEKSNWDKIQSKGYRFIKKPFAITELLFAIYQGLGKK